ncbi:Cephalosporin C deacetylase [uncultured Clostridium sp.]|uniref:acetylxylan esterase n=1 Tax=uncultured Clostridium sp. TaxID=59620 RepID=UPI000822F4A2|nr:acetylxylan esterase [uncultured Clostridium sp.]SCK01843.1 Cephalosporin C deacetylase [uncultured Clostridium sp.]
MPILDMPIEEMEEYLGKTICPRDFDLFWERQKEIANNIELDYTIIKKNFNNKSANYYEINFKGIDGANIYAKYICPNKDKKTPTVLEFHDYKGASRSWHHLTRYVGIGYSVIAMDCRGQGGKSEDIGNLKGSTVCGHVISGLDDEVENMYYCKVYLDGYILSRIVEELNSTDINRLIAFGKGQGAAIALVVSTLNQNIKKCSMQYPFLCDFKRVWDMDLDLNAYEGIRYYFRWFDPRHIREKEIFEKLGYIDIVNFAGKLNCEVFMGTALLDTVCPPSTQYAVFNNITCRKKHVIYPKYDHELNNFFENENLKFMRFER